MRLSAVAAYVLRYNDPNDADNARMTVLVRSESSDGVVGWGEAIAMWPEACSATAAIIEEGFFPLLRDAGEISVVHAWELMRAHSWWYGEGGIASFALSAIDMSLWDIAGKESGLPLSALFGGTIHDSLPATASCHVNKATLGESVAEVEAYFDRGFRSVKLGLGKKGLSPIGQDPDQVVRFVAMLRKALGTDAEILVDIGNGIRWDLATGVDVARRLKELQVGWIEEPFYPTRLDDYRALRQAVDLPIAGGEREWTVAGYERLLQAGAIDVVGVDPARAEGVTGFRKVDALVQAHARTINAHAWSTAITTAASLQLSLCSAAARLFELKPHAVVVQTDLVEEPITMKDGRVSLPRGPGLGISIVEDVVKRLAVR